MYGANYLRLAYDEAPLGYIIGTASTTFAKGDILSITSGYGVVSGANSIPLGICDASKVTAVSNETVAKVEIPFYSADQIMEFEMDFNATETVAYQGYFYQLTGTTGAMQVAASTRSTTIGVVQLLKLDPRREGSLVRGLFRFARPAMGYTVAT